MSSEKNVPGKMPWLENDQLLLRAIEPEDLEWLYGIENDRTLWDVSSSNIPYSKFALKQYIAEQPRDIFLCGELRLVVCLKPGGRPIGLADITNFSPTDSRAEIGITIQAAEREKGYGRAVLGLLEAYARNFLHLHQFYAHVSREHNPGSQKLFASAGYKEIATLPQWHFFRGQYEDISIFQKILQKNAPEYLPDKK